MTRPTVLIAYKSLPKYRVRFFEELRERLAADGVSLQLIYGQGSRRDAQRQEGAALEWGTRRRNRALHWGPYELIWQPCVREAIAADLVIVEQASRLLVNYLLLTLQAVRMTKVAFWGHGANLQRHSAVGPAESVKRMISRYPHWWFAYTEGCRQRVAEIGYPAERITVAQNAQDTEYLAEAVGAARAEGVCKLREEYALGSGPVGLFLGSLVEDKRLPFLLQAASRVVAARPDFRLLVAGDGPLRPLVIQAAGRHSWLTYLGRVDEMAQRALVLAASDVLLIPGLVGLVALDSLAAAVPLITTAVDFHSPEIEYIEDGVNGVIVKDPDDPAAYASMVLQVIDNQETHDKLVRGCCATRGAYTLAGMVDRFADGVEKALAT